VQPSDAEQVLQMRLAGCLPPQSTHITMARKACCCRFPRRWTASQHSLQYLQRRNSFLSQFDYMLRVKNGSAHESRHTFSAALIPQKAQSTMNAVRREGRRKIFCTSALRRSLGFAHATRVCVAFRMDLLREFSLSRPTKAQ